MTERYLIAGLGNPGREYKHNRHNVGFQVIDHLAARHRLAFSRIQNHAFVSSGSVAGRSVVMAKPQLYMNRSGGPLKALVKFYKVPLDKLLVVVDDIDLPLGTLRLRPEGSSGGQNGMRDIIEHLGTQEFARLRIGIGRPPGKRNAAGHVLQDFDRDEQDIIDQAYERASDAIETWLQEGITLAMSRHNAPVSAP